MKKTLADLQSYKPQGRKLTVLTAYDAPTAALLEQVGVDLILVGDSVGTNVLGYASEQEVTLADMTHHVRAVRRGSPHSLILVDLPYGTYSTATDALTTATHLRQAGADAVKLEGPQTAIVSTLVRHGIPVCGHLGLLPQTQQERRVQGKTLEEALVIWQGALQLAEVGVFALLLELIPQELATLISQHVAIPTIGIGAGAGTDGQVLVIHDIWGWSAKIPRLAKRYQDFRTLARESITAYINDVRSGHFPTADHSRAMDPQVWAALKAQMQE
ncbi:MAG: 3-methyl-2-oxobutanoate hydroxymethyltransferase [Synechococcales cyanobacterium]